MPVSRHQPLCDFCKYLDWEQRYRDTLHPECQAFPEGIPDEILDEQYDHREPHPQDNGIQFAPEESLEELSNPRRLLPAYKTMEAVKVALTRTCQILNLQRASGYTQPPLKPKTSDDESVNKTDE